MRTKRIVRLHTPTQPDRHELAGGVAIIAFFLSAVAGLAWGVAVLTS